MWSALKGTVKEKQTAQRHDKVRNIALSNSLNRGSKKYPSGIWGWEELIMKGFFVADNFVESEGGKQE